VGVRNKTSTQDGVYDAETKRRLFPTFVKDVILKNELDVILKNELNGRRELRSELRSELQTLINDLGKNNSYDNYDDAVKEDIGRILLAYEPNITKLGGGGGGGGKTRKRSRRMVRRHSNTRNCKPKSSGNKTRRRRRCTNVHKTKQTRKYIDVMDGMH
jgi:hypothetical protein